MTLRIILAEHHRLVRESLQVLLAREPGIEVVGAAGDGLVALQLVREQTPDVLVIDLSLPGLNGQETIMRALAGQPNLHILCLSSHGDFCSVASALDSGARGYLLKESSSDELALAIRKVGANLSYLSKGIDLRVLDLLHSGAARQDRIRRRSPALTRREREIVQLLSEGLTTQQIAERLHLSGKTVATHRENVRHKLGLDGIAQLTRYALREGLSSLEHACARSEPAASLPAHAPTSATAFAEANRTIRKSPQSTDVAPSSTRIP